jgi:BlaI family transcriptional regulator, penicillinase repressor
MKQPPRISDAEWDVMKIVWKRKEPCSAQAVIDALKRTNAWSDATVKTLLNRLVKKGALTFEKEGKAYLYSPAATEAECRAAETETFLERVFDGSLSPLIAHFAKARGLQKKDLEDLEELLRKSKKP